MIRTEAMHASAASSLCLPFFCFPFLEAVFRRPPTRSGRQPGLDLGQLTRRNPGDGGGDRPPAQHLFDGRWGVRLGSAVEQSRAQGWTWRHAHAHRRHWRGRVFRRRRPGDGRPAQLCPQRLAHHRRRLSPRGQLQQQDPVRLADGRDLNRRRRWFAGVWRRRWAGDQC